MLDFFFYQSLNLKILFKIVNLVSLIVIENWIFLMAQSALQF